MFLDDSFQHGRATRVIPRAFGIDDGDGAAHADAQARGLGAIDERVGADKIQFLQACLEKIPRGLTRFARAALGFLGVHAEEDVARDFFEAEFGGGGGEFGINRVHFLFYHRGTERTEESFFNSVFSVPR